jgi:hypothetical protein
MTIHDNIDSLLAADLHDELSEAERNDLHAHLVECATCRQLHQENKVMSKILEETLAPEKPDGTFEQRMLSGFRNRVPEKTQNLTGLIANLLRLRSVRIAAAAAVLLALVQIGRMITHENARGPRLVAGLTGDMPRLELHRDFVAKSASGLSSKKRKLNFEQAAGGNEPGTFSKYAAADAVASAPQAEPQFRGEAGALAKAPAAPRQAPTNAGAERVIVTGSQISAAEEVAGNPAETPASPSANRKLIRNATVALEVASFEDAVQKITAFANEGKGYVATSDSQKQANGKLKGEVVVKILPENLDRFLQKVRGLGELKDQTIGTEDITKQYLDTGARLKNARVMEQRLIDMLKTKTGKVSDLLQVEKELGRVREEIEKMQGELKYWDSQVQFATVTISIAEKDMEEPAAFLLKEHDQLALYVADVEKSYNEIKSLASPKVQITNARLDRDNAGRVSARMSMLIVPEESDAVIDRVKKIGRIDRFQTQTERVAQGGSGISENAKTKRDKVELNITITRGAEEQAVQQTSLRILTANVDHNAARLKSEATKSGAEIRNSTFSRDPDGREVANISLRLPMKNYAAMMKSLNQLGKIKDVQVERHDRMDKNVSEENAPADISIQIYSQGNIVSPDTGLLATLRNTLAQGVGALMWSMRMIGVAIAFLAPWAVALAVVVWILRRITRARRSKS